MLFLDIIGWLRRYVWGHPNDFKKHIACSSASTGISLDVTIKRRWFSLFRCYQYTLSKKLATVTRSRPPVAVSSAKQASPNPPRYVIRSPIVAADYRLKIRRSGGSTRTPRCFAKNDIISCAHVLGNHFDIKIGSIWRDTGRESCPRYEEVTDFDAVRIIRVLQEKGAVLEYGTELFEVIPIKRLRSNPTT